jgi:DnaJ-class molecular chaperone
MPWVGKMMDRKRNLRRTRRDLILPADRCKVCDGTGHGIGGAWCVSCSGTGRRGPPAPPNTEGG